MSELSSRLRKPARRIALIGNASPRRCGIATFTDDVRSALLGRFPDLIIDTYAMNDPGKTHAYGPEVVGTISQDELADYAQTARQINESGADVVLLQHEYGIYGGPAGEYIVHLLDRIAPPVVTTLHTVLTDPNPDQRRVLDAIIRRSARVVVMAEKGAEILRQVHGVDATKLVVVPHGIPDRTLIDAVAMKSRFGFEGRKVLLTFGLLSPNKGIETMVHALPSIVEAHPDTLYVVLGATHPHLIAREGESYREHISTLAAELGVSDNIRFINEFTDREDLLDYLAATDVYVTPYLNEAQITSGTLSYAVGLGKAVVSTPYWHAAELLADGVGKLVPFGNAPALGEAIVTLLGDEQLANGMRAAAYGRGRTMIWSRVAETYRDLFDAAVASRPVRLQPANKVARPSVTMAAVERMSDGTGILQHSIFNVPNREHGYCLDDNARALILAHRVTGEDQRTVERLAAVYASFIQQAWNLDAGRFRNFMAFDRSWLEEVGSEDSFGRGLWALGVTAAEARRNDMRIWATALFEQAAAAARALTAPRTQAFCILGAAALLDAVPSHGLARELLTKFGSALRETLAEGRRSSWLWFESVLAYDNARLPEALLRAGRLLGDNGMIADGLATLEWLGGKQTAPAGHFRAVGSESFGREYADPLPFDQQPLEAYATIEACEAAYLATGEARWMEVADKAYAWYLGENDLGLRIATIGDGGCYDGLMPDRANLNQGAESVLSFQLAGCAMERLSVRKAVGEFTNATG